MCFLQAEIYFVLVFSVYKYFRICQNKRKCSYTSGFFEGVITFSIECMYIWSNSLWHVLWQKWSEITKCITLLWVNGNILPTRNRIFLNSTSLLFFVSIKAKKFLYCDINDLMGMWKNICSILLALWCTFIRNNQSFLNTVFTAEFWNCVTFFLCACHYSPRVVKVSWQS